MVEIFENKDLLTVVFGLLGDSLTGSTYKSICLVNKIFFECIKRVVPDADTSLVHNLHEIMRQYNIKEYEELSDRMSWDGYVSRMTDWTNHGCHDTNTVIIQHAFRRNDVPDKYIREMYNKYGCLSKTKKTFEEYVEILDIRLDRRSGNIHDNIKKIFDVMDTGVFPPKGTINNEEFLLHATFNKNYEHLLCNLFTFEDLKHKYEEYYNDGFFRTTFEMEEFENFALMLPYTPYSYIKNGVYAIDRVRNWMYITKCDPIDVFEVADRCGVPRWHYLGNQNIEFHVDIAYELGKEIGLFIKKDARSRKRFYVHKILSNPKIPVGVIIDIWKLTPSAFRKYSTSVSDKKISFQLMLDILKEHETNGKDVVLFKKFGYSVTSLTEELLQNPEYNFYSIEEDLDGEMKHLDRMIENDLSDLLEYMLESCVYSHKDITPEMMNKPQYRRAILRNSFQR